MIRADAIDDRAVWGRLRGFADATGRALLDEIVLTGRNLAVSLARSQQPFGLGRDAEAMGKAAVERDIRRVYISVPGFYAQLKRQDPLLAPAFWKAWTNRDMTELERVARASRAGSGLEVLSVPDAATHGRRRGPRGRVQGKRPSALVTDDAALKNYIRKVQARVGMTKDGWADAAADCGSTRGIPVWAGGRHTGRHGGATIIPDSTTPEVVLRNDVPWAREGLPERVEFQAVAIAEERLVMRMEKILGLSGTVPF